jgi:hypothetical protein
VSAANASLAQAHRRGSPLHTTPGIPVHMHPVIALVTAAVEMDVLGIAYDQYPGARIRNEDVQTP